ncbi:EpsG family protein [Salmonella enterica]
MIETYLTYNTILLCGILISLAIGFVNKGKYTVYLMLFMALFIPAALRYGVGLDFFNYVDIFNRPDYYQDNIEIGFYLIVKSLSILGFGYQYLFVICSALTIFFFILSIDKSSAWASSLVFICTLYLSSYCLLRQILAVAILMYSCRLWIDDKKIKSIIFILLACSMHYSAVLFIPIVIVSSIFKLTTYRALFIMVFITMFVFALHGVDLIFNNKIFLNSKYGSYVSSSFNKETDIGSGIGVIIQMMMPISVAIMSNKILALNKKNNIVIFTTIAFFASYLLATQVYIFGRMADVFSFSLIFAAPLLLKSARSKLSKIAFIGIIILYVPLMQATIKNNNYNNNELSGSGLGIAPYKTVFDK